MEDDREHRPERVPAPPGPEPVPDPPRLEQVPASPLPERTPASPLRNAAKAIGCMILVGLVLGIAVLVGVFDVLF